VKSDPLLLDPIPVGVPFFIMFLFLALT
jgi:hypothetical protein